jgi:hypothetical protein
MLALASYTLRKNNWAGGFQFGRKCLDCLQAVEWCKTRIIGSIAEAACQSSKAELDETIVCENAFLSKPDEGSHKEADVDFAESHEDK